MPSSWSLLLLALLVAGARCGNAEALDVLNVLSDDATPPLQLQLVVASASFGASLPRVRIAFDSEPPLRLVLAQISSDCSRLETAPAASISHAGAFAALLDRGGPCSFVQKAAAAQNAGAALLVVGDTLQGAYASGIQSNRPIYDCALGRAVVARNASALSSFPLVDADIKGLGSCSTSRGCQTATCVYTGATGQRSSGFQVCCVANTLVRMGVDPQSVALASTITISAVFASYRDAQLLRKYASEDPSLAVRAFNADESRWNVTMLLTWLLGVLVVCGGAYCSATDERRFSYEKVALGSVRSDSLDTQYVSIDDREQPTSHRGNPLEGGDSDDAGHRVELSSIHALYFVVGSSTLLVLLFYGHLALLMNVLFLVVTTASLTQVVILPVFLSVKSLRALSPGCQEWLLPLVSIVLAASVAIYWFLNRTSASIWPLQDLLCITLCFVIIDSIQLPSLKVATVLLGVAFAYDIFFVYLSPLVFGSSVMVDVASGGGSIQADADSGPVLHERLPMVLTIPLLFSYYGGNALLGLGDLILPGLLISFCIRYDYCMGYPLSRSYFVAASSSYAAGLLLANFMAIALRDIVGGQPALMYIVPFMLGSVAVLASRKEELDELWHGPKCLHMELAFASSLNNDRLPRPEEVEPFLKKR